MSAASDGCQIQTLYVFVFTRTMSAFLDLLGVTMVLLTTTPIGKLLLALASTIHERYWVILLVLPSTTFTELARTHIGSWVLPTHTWA